MQSSNLLDLEGLKERVRIDRDKQQIDCAWCDEAEALLDKLEKQLNDRPKNDG